MKAGNFAPETYGKLLETLSALIYRVQVDDKASLDAVAAFGNSSEIFTLREDGSVESQSYLLLIHPADRENYRKTRLNPIHEPIYTPLEYRIKNLKGEWVKVKDSLLRFESGKYIECCLQTVTENVNQESADTTLKAFQTAVNTASIVSVTDTQGVIQYANDLFCQISEYTREELVGKNHNIVNSGYHPVSFFQNLWSTIQSGGIFRAEICNRSKSGKLYWVDTVIAPVFNCNAEIIQYLSIRNLITERKIQEQKLIEATAFSQELINSLDFILGVINFQGELLEVNKAWEAFANLPDFDKLETKTKGANYFTLLRQAPLLSPEKAEEIIQGIEHVIQHADAVFNAELNYGPFWFNLKVNRFLNSELLVLSHYDITRMKEVKQRLASSEARLRTILDTEPECVKILDHEGRLVEMNKAGLAMVDTDDIDEVLGQKVVDLVLPEYKHAFEKSVHDAILGKSTSLEFVINSLKGRQKVMESQVVPFNHNSGNPQVLSITRDITEKKMSEAIARRVDERFRHLIENINDCFLLDDLEGNITFANKQFHKTFGFDPEKSKKTFRDLVAPEHLSMVQFRHNNRVHNREQVESTFEFLAINANGERVWMEANVTVIKAEGVITGTQSILRNIHQRKQSEFELESMNQQLRERNEELDSFVYSISHDLRSPIISLMSVLDIVEEEYLHREGEVALKDYHHQLRSCANRTDQIIRNILYYSKNKNLGISKEKVRLAQEISLITEQQKQLAGIGNIQFVNQINPELVLETDPLRLKIVLENILSNAIRYQKTENNHTPVIVAGLKQINGYSLIISIKDNGDGIPADVLPNIFKMFYRGTPKSTGSGLGLYLAQEAVKKLKGTIQVNTAPGEGSEFLICFPENTHDKI